MTKKELFRYGINSESDCLYCREPDNCDNEIEKSVNGTAVHVGVV